MHVLWSSFYFLDCLLVLYLIFIFVGFFVAHDMADLGVGVRWVVARSTEVNLNVRWKGSIHPGALSELLLSLCVTVK